jgi:LysM repeat protein/lysophospholipase L1-like esterase
MTVTKWLMVLFLAVVVMLGFIPASDNFLLQASINGVNLQRPKDLIPHASKEVIRNIGYINGYKFFTTQYPFIRYTQNQLQSNKTPIEIGFFNALGDADKQQIRIIHIGDSHLQADVYSGVVRNRLQSVFGNAGRGFVFPYRLVKSNSPGDYTSTAKGVWSFSRSTSAAPVYDRGISGYTLVTDDESASFTINFRNPNGPSVGNRVRLLCDNNPTSFDVQIACSAIDTIFEYEASTNRTFPELVIDLPRNLGNSFTISFSKTRAEQKRFKLYGIILENTDSAGVLYQTMGVNGARIPNLTQSAAFPEHLRLLHPNLVILDIGVNDYYPSNKLPGYVKDSLDRLVNMVAEFAPDATILLNSQQPNQYKKRNVPGCKPFSLLLNSLLDHPSGRVMLYDYFKVTDTKNAVKQWQNANLMQNDGIHLTHAGYRHKGELLSNAILSGYQDFLKQSTSPLGYELKGQIFASESDTTEATTEDSFEDNEEVIAVAGEADVTTVPEEEEEPKAKKANPYRKTPGRYAKPQPTQYTYHTIVRGDNLGAIARKYRVTITAIKKANNIKGTSITAGDKLKIPKMR